MDIVITAGEAIDRGIWDGLCALRGWDAWVVNEGRMSIDERITITGSEADLLGLGELQAQWDAWRK